MVQNHCERELVFDSLKTGFSLCVNGGGPGAGNSCQAIGTVSPNASMYRGSKEREVSRDRKKGEGREACSQKRFGSIR